MELISPIYLVGLFLACAFVPLLLLVALIQYIKKKQASHSVTPLTSDLLRPPGFSLQQRLDDIQWDLMECLSIIPLIMTAGPMILLLQTLAKGRYPTLVEGLLMAGVLLLFVSYYVRKAVRLVKTRTALRLGHACERAVGQELEPLIRPNDRPYRVFHDIPFDGFNIDHLVVNPSGVFVVETKGRSKPLNKGNKQFKVRIEGDALHFPHRIEREPLLQTRRNVQAVRKWLCEATGFEVPVAGVLILPGWFLERKQRMADPYVMNATELARQLPSLHAGVLELGQVQAIAHQVAQRVRDVDRERADRAVSRPVGSH
ncbi:nuclease [Zobellella endophytica]|uniref:Nuclease n=1 Tax=Zobellella endophytica TaxID=2116700 RepID=A0A2P7R601_9GAMM|nr:nuclease-related domain-containing protein [Zobellella endophytica]PSJ45645.1 nuclease [Zobellella endophytica]